MMFLCGTRLALPKGAVPQLLSPCRAWLSTRNLSPEEVESRLHLHRPGSPGPGEADERKRRRLLYQSEKRGWLELDLILGSFARRELPAMSRGDMDAYESLLVEGEHTIFAVVMGTATLDHLEGHPVLNRLRQHVREGGMAAK